MEPMLSPARCVTCDKWHTGKFYQCDQCYKLHFKPDYDKTRKEKESAQFNKQTLDKFFSQF